MCASVCCGVVWSAIAGAIEKLAVVMVCVRIMCCVCVCVYVVVQHLSLTKTTLSSPPSVPEALYGEPTFDEQAENLVDQAENPVARRARERQKKVDLVIPDNSDHQDLAEEMY